MKGENDRNNARLFAIRDILKGLCFLHHYNLVHCDLKPINILHDDKFGICIGDLGSAFPVGSKNMNMTTYNYASDDEIITAGHDMFSLAVIIAEMWNPNPWMESYVEENEKGEFTVKKSGWSAYGVKATTDDVNITYGKGGGYYAPSNPDWKKASVINVRGIDISALPDEWREVVICLLAPNPQHRFSAASLLRKFNVNVFSTYERRIITPIPTPTTMKMIPCTFIKLTDEEVKVVFSLYSSYAHFLGLDKKGDHVEGGEKGEIIMEKDCDREIDEEKMKVFLYLRTIVTEFDPTDGDEKDENEIFDTLTTDQVISMYSSIDFFHDLFWPVVERAESIGERIE